MGLPNIKPRLPVFAAKSREEKTDNAVTGNWIFCIAFILSLIGFLFIVDTAFVFKGKFTDGSAFGKILKEGAIFIFGWICAIQLSRLDRPKLKTFGAALMFVSLGMLMLVDFTPLGIEKGGSCRWLDLGFFTVQPLEFFKLALVLHLAMFISESGNLSKHGLGVLIRPGIIVTLGIILLALQPNISAVFFVGALWLIIALISGLPTKRLLVCVGILLFVFVTLVICFDRFGRFQSWLSRQVHAGGPGYQVEMALKAIAHGQVFGVGLGKSIGKFSVPFNDSDFIYTIIVEETGLVGGTVVVLLFAGLIYLIWRLVKGQKENYPLLVCAGIGVMIAMQAAINIAVNLALIPPTGVPLPFISAGGSSLIVMLLAIGILLNMAGGPASKPQELQPGS